MRRTLDVFYIRGSDNFGSGDYRSDIPYSLVMAKSMKPDSIKGKQLYFGAEGLYLGENSQWDKLNSGILTYVLHLANRIYISGKGQVQEKVVERLEFILTFENAGKGRLVGGIGSRPIFSGINVDEYLTASDGTPQFSLELGLAKSCGDNSNRIIGLVSEAIKLPGVRTGLTIVPFGGVISEVFELVKRNFFTSEEAAEIWPAQKIIFTAGTGVGYPLRIGRYLFVSTELSRDQVEARYRYLGGRLVDVTGNFKEVKEADQFYLEIFAK